MNPSRLKVPLAMAVAAILASACAATPSCGVDEYGVPSAQAGSLVPPARDAQSGVWSAYAEIRFDPDRPGIPAAYWEKVTEIVDHLRRHPDQQVGLDGSPDTGPVGAGPRQVGFVRSALVQAGVPSARIMTGVHGDPQNRRSDRVEVLFRPR